MHKIIHVTDPHIVVPGRTLYGIDPAQRLRETFEHISRTYSDAAAILVTGDLADAGEPAAYAILQDILAEVSLPVHLTIGNHDNRAAFREVFGGEGFVQIAFDVDDWRIILLDTRDDDSHYGTLDGGRFEWLEEQLVYAAGRPVLLAMHHTPTDLHMPMFSKNDMRDPVRFIETVRKYADVRHMLFGHRHIGAAGSYAGIPFTANRGTAHHIIVDIEQRGKVELVAAPPSYDAVFLDDLSVIIHRHDGLDTLPRIRVGDPK